MKKFEDFFTFKKYNIFYRVIYNENQTSDIGILYLHGKNVHSYYLDKLIDDKHNFTYFAFDNPGQGRSSGRRGHCNIYKIIPLLIKYFIENIITQYNICNLYIMGESLGSLTGFYFVNNYKFEDLNLAGIIFIPAVFKIKKLDNIFLRFILLLTNIFFPALLIKNRTSFSFYTNDRQKLKELNSDKYYGKKVSARFLTGLYFFYKYFKKNIHLLKIPVMFVHGKYDHYSGEKELMDNFKKLKQNTNKEILFLPKSNHWILISDEFTKRKDRLYNWIIEVKKDTSCLK